MNIFKRWKELISIEKKYYELLFCVTNKYPNETRHETALRYIKGSQSYTTGSKEDCIKEAEKLFNTVCNIRDNASV